MPSTETPEDISASDNYAKAIGYVCIEWGLLEGTFDRFMRQLMGWTHRDEVTHILNMNIRLSEKIKVIRAIGAMNQLSRQWFEELCACLTIVDNEIRPLRNCYVHDMWHVGQAEPFSCRTRTTTIQRPEAFKLQVSAFSDTVTPISEIVELVTKIRSVAARLDSLATEYGSRRHQ